MNEREYIHYLEQIILACIADYRPTFRTIIFGPSGQKWFIGDIKKEIDNQRKGLLTANKNYDDEQVDKAACVQSYKDKFGDNY